MWNVSPNSVDSVWGHLTREVIIVCGYSRAVEEWSNMPSVLKPTSPMKTDSNPSLNRLKVDRVAYCSSRSLERVVAIPRVGQSVSSSFGLARSALLCLLVLASTCI